MNEITESYKLLGTNISRLGHCVLQIHISSFFLSDCLGGTKVYIGEYFQYLSSCSVKLIEFQTFGFVMYKLVTIVITTYMYVFIGVVVPITI